LKEEGKQLVFDGFSNISFDKSDIVMGEYLIFDLETTGFPLKQNALISDFDNWPRVIQISWILLDKTGKLVNSENHYISLSEKIAADSVKVHGITDELLKRKGEPVKDVLLRFYKDIDNCRFVVAHGAGFDIPVIESEFLRENIKDVFVGKTIICTMEIAKNYCKLPALEIGKYREPGLEEMFKCCFYPENTKLKIKGLHNASVDAAITAKCFIFFIENNILNLHSNLIMEQIKVKPRWNLFFVRIILPSLLSISLFILTIFIIIIPRFESNIMHYKKQMIKELTNSAWSVLQEYELEESKGRLSRDSAQQEAIKRIKYLRYGEDSKDYFWITDMKPTMIMHPYLNYLDGLNLSDFKDPHGKKLFVEFVKAVKQNGEGYEDYMWQYKDDSTHIVSKISYVKVFSPWGWIIGTGVYVEDVKKEIKSLTGKLIQISIGITILIIILLVINTHQTFKIEKSRISAENKLKESRERYKTLVEASTEGMVLISEGVIAHTNKTFNTLTAFNSEELIGKSFSSLIDKSSISRFLSDDNEFKLEEGKYEVVLKKNNGNSIDVILLISSITINNTNAKIIIVKDVSVALNIYSDSVDYSKLISSVKTGFFRTSVDLKGRFIAANQATLNILGYQSVKELADIYILELFVDIDDKRTFRKKLLESGTIHRKRLSLATKNQEKKIVDVSLVISYNDENVPQYCDGIIEDVTEQVENSENVGKELVNYQYSWLFLEQNIKDFLKPALSVDMNLPVNSVTEMMLENNADYVLLSHNNSIVGIITETDIKQRLVSENKSYSCPAYEIMSSPVIYSKAEFSLKEALLFCKNKSISYILVKNFDDKVEVAKINTLADEMLKSVDLITANASSAKSVRELKNLHKRMLSSISILTDAGINVRFINKKITEFLDTATTVLIKDAIKTLGEPPVPFAFIALGSEGRFEQSLATDQDNAIIFNDIDVEELENVNEYFLKLGQIVCQNLNEIGYSHCKGNNMASNPKWCQPYSKWEVYFANWIMVPDAKNLLDVSIFFDFRTIYGDFSFTDNLKSFINRIIENKTSFFFNMIDNAANFKISLGTSGSGTQDSKGNSDVFDIKKPLAAIVMFTRIYTIRYKVNELNTMSRIDSLYNMQIFSKQLKEELEYNYQFLMRLRLNYQIDKIKQGSEADNFILTANLNENDLMILKKILAKISNYHTKLNLDFKGITV